MGRSPGSGPGRRGRVVALAAAILVAVAGGAAANASPPAASPAAPRSTGWHPRLVMVADLRPGKRHSSMPEWFTAAHRRLFFRADDGVHGVEPWVSDGTRRGTTLVGDLVHGRRGSYPTLVVPARRATVFTTTQDGRGRWRAMLWSPTAGAHRGSRTVRRLLTGPRLSDWGVGARVGRYAVIATDSPTRLRRTDGTVAGTTVVKGWPRGSAPVWDLIPAGRFAWFTRGTSLWRTDGTTAGTRLLRRWSGGDDGPSGWLSVVVGRRLFFTASTRRLGDSLWTSDGTRAGTHLVKDIYPGPEPVRYYPVAPAYFVRHGRWAVFIAGDGRHGRQLWRSDGTARGTTRLTDVPAISLADLTSCGGALYFTARDDAHGDELWVRSGRPARVRRIDIAPGPLSSRPEHLTCVLGHLVFTARDKVADRDPWTLAGPRARPVQHDIRHGNSVARSADVTRVGTDVFFAARDGVHGRELWVLHAR